ncbi:hypothetical protein ABTF80_21425, partial [Acinetobacter baumannii]
AIVSCPENERVIDDMPGFELRLRARFPQIGFLEPDGGKQVVSMAHALAAAALALQNQAGCPVTFTRTVSTVETGIYQVVVEY